MAHPYHGYDCGELKRSLSGRATGGKLPRYGGEGGKDFGGYASGGRHAALGAVLRDVLGMQLVYGGEDTYFSSLRATDAEYPILNLEQGHSVSAWGRVIFYVADVDAFWRYLKERGFDPERPQDASWGERYFHMCDPDGHELSFAHPLRPAS